MGLGLVDLGAAAGFGTGGGASMRLACWFINDDLRSGSGSWCRSGCPKRSSGASVAGLRPAPPSRRARPHEELCATGRVQVAATSGRLRQIGSDGGRHVTGSSHCGGGEHFDTGAFKADLARAVAIPTESQNPDRVADLLRYLETLIAPMFKEMGFTTRILTHPAANGPFIYAERIEDPGRPTVLAMAMAT